MKVSIVGSLCDREVACSASDHQGSNFQSCVWRTVSSKSSHHPQEVLLAQFSLYVHKGGLKPDSFHFFPGRSNGKSPRKCHICLGYLFSLHLNTFFAIIIFILLYIIINIKYFSFSAGSPFDIKIRATLNTDIIYNTSLYRK